MLSDRKKIDILIDENYFNSNQISHIIIDIKHLCIKHFFNDYDLKISDEVQNIIINKWRDCNFNDDDFIYELKQHITNNEFKIHSNIFNEIKKNLMQGIERGTAVNKYYFSTKSIIYSAIQFTLVRDAIIELTGINEEILSVNNEEEFRKLLSKNTLEITTYFKKYQLQKILRLYDEDDFKSGLNDFENYITLPTFIDYTIINDDTKQLEKSIFIEGISGSGKTTVAQTIAYKISKNNSYYIDLATQIKDDFYQDKYEDDIIQFLQILKHNYGILILDNIQISNETKMLARFYLQESNKIKFKLIVIAQYEITTKYKQNFKFSDKYFHHKDNNLKNNLKFIELSQNSSLQTRLSLIDNLLQYYINKEIIDENQISSTLLHKVEKEFGPLIVFLKIAIEDTGDINSLYLNSAMDKIIEKYRIFINNKRLKHFIQALCLLSSKNITFYVDKKVYHNSFVYERMLLSQMIELKLIHKLEHDDKYSFVFPHNAIPKLLLTAIANIHNTNFTVINFKSINYLLDTNSDLVQFLISTYIYEKSYPLVKKILKNQFQDPDKIQVYNIITLDSFLKILNYYGKDKTEIIFNQKMIELITKELLANDYRGTLFFIKDLIKLKLYDLAEHTIDIVINNADLFYNIKLTIFILTYLNKYNYDKFNLLVTYLLNNKNDFILNLQLWDTHNILYLYKLKEPLIEKFLNSNLDKIFNIAEEMTITKFIVALNIFKMMEDDKLLNNELREIKEKIILSAWEKINETIKNLDLNNIVKLLTILHKSNHELEKELFSEICNILNDDELFLFNVLNDISNLQYFNIFLNLINSIQHPSLSKKIKDIINNKIILPKYYKVTDDTWSFFIYKNQFSIFEKKLIDHISKDVHLHTNISIEKIHHFVNILDTEYKKQGSNVENLFTNYTKVIKKISYSKPAPNIYYPIIINFFARAYKYRQISKYTMSILSSFTDNDIVSFAQYKFIFNNTKGDNTLITKGLLQLLDNNLHIFNKFLDYLEKKIKMYSLFLNVFAKHTMKPELKYLYQISLDKNPDTVSLFLHRVYFSDKDLLHYFWHENLINIYNVENKYKLFGYSTLNLFSKSINTLSSEKDLNIFKQILFANIKNEKNNLYKTILELNGLLLLIDNDRFFQNLIDSNEIKILYNLYQKAKINHTFGHTKIDYFDKIFNNLYKIKN